MRNRCAWAGLLLCLLAGAAAGQEQVVPVKRSDASLLGAMRAGAPLPGTAWPDRLRDADDVVYALTKRGFSRVSEVRQRGRAFICEATGPRRERVRLVLDAATGEISGMKVIGFDGGRD